MGKIPQQLREIICNNVRECRMKKYPGRGGAKKCAEDFGVSPQQWSLWEKGNRVPGKKRLEEIAKFFGVSVESLHSKNYPAHDTSSTPPATIVPGISIDSHAISVSIPHAPETIMALHSMHLKAVYEVEICIKNVRYIPADT